MAIYLDVFRHLVTRYRDSRLPRGTRAALLKEMDSGIAYRPISGRWLWRVFLATMPNPI